MRQRHTSANKTAGQRIADIFVRYGTLGSMAATFVAFSYLAPFFATIGNLQDIFRQSSILLLLALGFTFVYITGNLDLSVGAVCSMTGVIVAKLFEGGYPFSVALLCALGFGATIGIINSITTVKLRINSLLSTLALMFVLEGLETYITRARGLYPNMPTSFITLGEGFLLGIPWPTVVSGGLLILGIIFLRNFPSGRYFYAIGENPEVAHRSGINVQLHCSIAYLLSGLLSAVGGVLLTARLGSAQYHAGEAHLMYAIAATFLGTTMGTRGKPTLEGTFLGVLYITVIQNGLVMLNLQWYWRYVVTGVILVLAVMLAMRRRGKQ